MFLGGWEIVVLLGWPVFCGLACAAWERFRLAPRQLSPGVPPFLSGTTWVVVFGSLLLMFDASLEDVVIIGGVFAVIGLLPASCAFAAGRWVLRSRSQNGSAAGTDRR